MYILLVLGKFILITFRDVHICLRLSFYAKSFQSSDSKLPRLYAVSGEFKLPGFEIVLVHQFFFNWEHFIYFRFLSIFSVVFYSNGTMMCLKSIFAQFFFSRKWNLTDAGCLRLYSSNNNKNLSWFTLQTSTTVILILNSYYVPTIFRLSRLFFYLV